jgi:hypothetical protein
MAQATIDLLERGIEANRADPFRQGNLVHLPETGTLVIGGDVHGHRRNFERLATYTALADHTDRHLILQEIIHGGPEDDTGGCLSYQLLFDAVRLKLEFPDRVHFVMGNHDTACICGSEVMKNGKEMNRAMSSALVREFALSGDEVESAIKRFLFSQPLAVRCHNRVWVSHSLPNDRWLNEFDPGIFDRELQLSDCAKPGSAYLLTWGRRHSQETLDRLARSLDADLFIVGHQAQATGWCQAGSNLLILASDHNHGCLLELNLSQTYTAATVSQAVVPLASIP